MPANIEFMFHFREKPWHSLGTAVQEAPTSADALIYAGLDWEVIQKNVYTEDDSLIPGYKANLRDTDSAALGIVSDRYRVVQNQGQFTQMKICYKKRMEIGKEHYEQIAECFPKQRKPAKISNLDVLNAALYVMENGKSEAKRS